ncbi:hypothetical protein ABZ860_25185 [Microbispora sp. NPDC046973]|uniref:hypothetical protein n=1 Tax=Microbispora sp. NPDC046973 TaxID=3155022 RepID=UPI0033DD814F
MPGEQPLGRHRVPRGDGQFGQAEGRGQPVPQVGGKSVRRRADGGMTVFVRVAG